MSEVSEDGGEVPSDNESGPDLIDPRAPRFGQSVTASLLLFGAALQEALLVYVVATVLVLAVASGWRVDAYALLWRHGAVQLVGRPEEQEAVAPHRFAKLLGATGSMVAAVLLFLGFDTVGFAVGGVVGLLAAVAAVTGFCLGCKMYREVSFLRRRGLI